MSVSIIIVTLNCANNLSALLGSIKEIKSSNEVECIFVDGGSRDGTVDLIKSFNDIKTVFISEPDNGIYDAMNKGLNLANFEYIYFINSDDRIVPKTFDSIIKKTEKNTKNKRLIICDVLISGWGYTWYGDARKIPSHQGVIFPKSEIRFDEKMKVYADGNYLEKNFDRFPKYYVAKPLAEFALGGISNSGNLYVRGIELFYFSKKSFIRFIFKSLLDLALGERRSRQIVYYLKGIKRV
jgi:glycosyltransferase involved in cell wall biosynthesis